MGPAFDRWTVEGLGFGEHQFCVQGRTPDEAVAAAIGHLGGAPLLLRDILKAQNRELRDALEQLEAQPQKKPTRKKKVAADA